MKVNNPNKNYWNNILNECYNYAEENMSERKGDDGLFNWKQYCYLRDTHFKLRTGKDLKWITPSHLKTNNELIEL